MAGLLGLHPQLTRQRHQERIGASRQIVRTLGLTDLCLFTEASYTRHLALADRITAFGDHPLALEHFPSGALAGPPPHLRERSSSEGPDR